MIFYNRIIGNFMVYKDRLETNLFQLFVHPQNDFLYISAIIFEVNAKTSIIGNDLVDFTSFHCPQLFYCPPALPLFRRPSISVENLKVLKTEKRLQLVVTNPG